MSLITCPECAHEVSATASACPNCGHPFAPPAVVHRRVVVAEAPERDDFPKWIFIPLGLLGIILLFVLFAYMRNNDDTANQRNINVSINTQRPGGAPLSNSTSAQTVTVPPSTTTVAPPMTTTALPPAPPSQTTITSVPGQSVTAPAPDKGSVTLEAKISTNSGSIQPVRAEKFYLLDKDLESILSEANI
ncbi:MAG: zinc ribbon domain-containing protein, partial [Acidobacteriota bacterium]|nr:zinc ribbon domain-containing protein [Acidobacteriota bacterium]